MLRMSVCGCRTCAASVTEIGEEKCLWLECHPVLRVRLPSVGIDQFCLVDPQINFRLHITQITFVSFVKFSADHSHEKYYRKAQAFFSRKQEAKLTFFMIRIRGLLRQSKIQLAIGYVSIGASPGFKRKG